MSPPQIFLRLLLLAFFLQVSLSSPDFKKTKLEPIPEFKKTKLEPIPEFKKTKLEPIPEYSPKHNTVETCLKKPPRIYCKWIGNDETAGLKIGWKREIPDFKEIRDICEEGIVNTEIGHFINYDVSDYDPYKRAHVQAYCILKKLGVLTASDQISWDTYRDGMIQWSHSNAQIKVLVSTNKDDCRKVLVAKKFKDIFEFGYAVYLCLEIERWQINDKPGKKLEQYDFEEKPAFLHFHDELHEDAVGQFRHFRQQYTMMTLMREASFLLPNGLINWKKFERFLKDSNENQEAIGELIAQLREECDEYLHPKLFNKPVVHASAAYHCMEIAKGKTLPPEKRTLLQAKMITALRKSLENAILRGKDTDLTLGYTVFEDDPIFIYHYMINLGYFMPNGQINWKKLENDLKIVYEYKAADRGDVEEDIDIYVIEEVAVTRKECEKVLAPDYYRDLYTQATKAYFCLGIFRIPYNVLHNTVAKSNRRMQEFTNTECSDIEDETKKYNCLFEALGYRDIRLYNTDYLTLTGGEIEDGTDKENRKELLHALDVKLNDGDERVVRADKLCSMRSDIVLTRNPEGRHLRIDGKIDWTRYSSDVGIETANGAKQPKVFDEIEETDLCTFADIIFKFFDKMKTPHMINEGSGSIYWKT